jgi:hypothetical protein
MDDFFSINSFRLTDHARTEMIRRQLTEDDIAEVLQKPEQIEMIRPGRIVCQSRIKTDEHSKEYLLRVFVDIDRIPPDVVTVYRTSKVEKYWRS